MSTLFTQIINGESPARFVWRDELCVAFLTIQPRGPGHTLVVPRREMDRWLDVEEDLMAHLMVVSHKIGLAQRTEWNSDRAGLMIEGYMVPHLHIHVWPSWSHLEFRPSGIDRDANPLHLEEAAVRLRSRLRLSGHGDRIPAEPTA